MQHALKRLNELREELERLRRTTERVLAESEDLITQITDPPLPPVPAVSVRPVTARRRRSPKPAAGRRAK